MKKSESTPRRNTKIGWIQPLLWGFVLAGWAAFNMHHGIGSLTGWVWNLLLIVFAAINFLVSAVAFFAKAWIDPALSAKRLAEAQKQLYGVSQVYRDAEPTDFRLLDKAFYAEKSEELEALRFRKMREVVNVTASTAFPKNHAVIRGFLDPSGTIYASIYDIRLFSFIRLLQLIGVIARKMKTVECESELSDGTFVATSNTKDMNKTLALPFMVRNQFPQNTATEAIVSSHRETLGAVLASKPGVLATVCANNADVQALQDRMHAMRSAFRASPAFDRRAEWQKIAGRNLSAIDEETLANFEAEMGTGAD